MSIKYIIFVLFLIIFLLFFQFLYFNESFKNINKIIELDLSKIETLQISSDSPVVKCGSHLIENKDNIITLDKYSSKYNINTYKNEFSYCRIFIDFILKPNVNKQNILIMGFGLGGMPLELSLNNEVMNIDTLDIDECMFKMYKTLIKNPPDKIKYYLCDASIYLNNTNKIYDIIIDDVFDYLDKKFYNFGEACDKLKKDGYLLINMHNYNDYLKYENELKRLFKNVFVDTTDNICVFCQK